MFLFPRPVVQLPNLATPSAADLAAKVAPAPESQALLKPGMSASEYIHTLEQKKQSVDAVKALAHGMPERDAVAWAAQSSQKVAAKLNPQEQAAAQAAAAWVQNPTEATQAAAAEAAGKTDFSGPGGWAAQAAAWSKQPPASAATAGAPAAGTAAPALAQKAVVGAILLAAGLANRPPMGPPQKPDLQAQAAAKDGPSAAAPNAGAPAAAGVDAPPIDQSKMAKALQPFIDLGKGIASGKSAVT